MEKKETKKPVIRKHPKKQTISNDLSINIYGLNGEQDKSVELPKDIFAVKVNPKLLAQYVRVYLINQRQGTASTKTRSEVTGSTRKIYRQKGTGKARHGDIEAPIFVGGGIVGGPKPKKYQAKLNKKVKKLAMKMALTLKAQEKNILGLANEIIKIKPKTKIMADLFKKLNLYHEKLLVVLPNKEKSNLVLAMRNIPRLEIANSSILNPYQLLNHHKILFIEEALTVLTNRINKNEG